MKMMNFRTFGSKMNISTTDASIMAVDEEDKKRLEFEKTVSKDVVNGMFSKLMKHDFSSNEISRFNKENLTDINEAMKSKVIDDYTKIPYSEFCDWNILLDMNNSSSNFRNMLSYKKVCELREHIQNWVEANMKTN